MNKDQVDFLKTLETRFDMNMNRHKHVCWVDVAERLKQDPGKVDILMEMERTGGEPDVVVLVKTPEPGVVRHSEIVATPFVFCDCSPESPSGRRSLCYDQAAWQARKTNKPAGSALGMAEEMGMEMLTEEAYRNLQCLGSFDQKTSSWIATPKSVREQGGALFCDYRYGQVFTYHNGAESYYSSRGFRGRLEV